MNRVEKFRAQRKCRRKYILLFLVFIPITLAGIAAADYSFNSLAKDENSVKLVSVHRINENSYNISFLNISFDLNIAYIKRDVDRIKSSFKRFPDGG